MIARVESFVLRGIDAVPCEIEADVDDDSLSKTTIVGLPDAAVRESMQRVRTALLNAGYSYPRGHVTINLAPAHIRKEGPVYDLPIAVALLQACGSIAREEDRGRSGVADHRGDDRARGLDASAPALARDFLLAGELALDGRVRPVRGGISLALLARRLKRRGVMVPADNAPEAAAVEGVDVVGIARLDEVVRLLNGERALHPHPPVDAEPLSGDAAAAVDFGDIRGQEAAKRALAVAAAGGHNVLMIGPAGTGKTMMAKALPGVLPPLTRDEVLEVTRIYSSAGQLPAGEALMRRRPVRSPHHTASGAAIIGGGSVPRPGEVTLAHRGVLFLDEMPEFSRAVLETLRQPLEDGCVTIARARGSVRFPARFMLVGAMNPTPGGRAAGDEVSRRAMERYLERLSGPLIDRVDIHVEVPRVPYRQLAAARRGTDTAALRDRVHAARALQRVRHGRRTNAELAGRSLDAFAGVDADARTLLGQAMSELGLSARAYDRIRRVARTIADLEASREVRAHHVAEAVQYRLLDRVMA